MPGLADNFKRMYDYGKLEKATLVHFEKTGASDKVKNKLEVQFNPSEYSIRRGYRLSEKRPLSGDIKPGHLQAAQAEPSVLSLRLYFDSYTELKAGQGAVNSALNLLNPVTNKLKQLGNKVAAHTILPSFDMNEDVSPAPHMLVNKRFEDIMRLIKYYYEEHEPPTVAFIWGENLNFKGKLNNYSASYTVFDRDGTPVRAQLDLTITGEEIRFVGDENPFESPDRTKQRTLKYGDTLWMMAQEEYGDAARWKTIAQANGILNPRALNGVMRLKVPSIR